MKKNNMILGGFLIIIAAIMWGLDGILLTPSYFSKLHLFCPYFLQNSSRCLRHLLKATIYFLCLLQYLEEVLGLCP